jgi:hypothetical protein
MQKYQHLWGQIQTVHLLNMNYKYYALDKLDITMALVQWTWYTENYVSMQY